MYQKAQRMTDISKGLANFSNNADVQQAYRAGLLAKSDLIYEMVFGFTDPQGVTEPIFFLATCLSRLSLSILIEITKCSLQRE